MEVVLQPLHVRNTNLSGIGRDRRHSVMLSGMSWDLCNVFLSSSSTGRPWKRQCFSLSLAHPSTGITTHAWCVVATVVGDHDVGCCITAIYGGMTDGRKWSVDSLARHNHELVVIFPQRGTQMPAQSTPSAATSVFSDGRNVNLFASLQNRGNESRFF